MDMGFAAKGGILSLKLKDQQSIYASYMPYVKGGGLFLETTKPHALGDDVFVLVEFMDQSEPIPVAAKVVWLAPSGSSVYRPGIGVQLGEDNRELMNRIETQISELFKSPKPTLTM